MGRMCRLEYNQEYHLERRVIMLANMPTEVHELSPLQVTQHTGSFQLKRKYGY